MTYDVISRFYDLFTDGFDYSDYLNCIYEKCPDFPVSGLALDCGCGTGTLLELLSERGFDCTGVDESADMLSEASRKLPDAHLVCQRLSEINMYGAYDAVFCTLDTVNHLLDKRELNSFFRRIGNFVEPDGFFVFDTKSLRFFTETACDIAEERDGDYLVIKGAFDGKFSEYMITDFSRKKNGDWKRFDSEVTERFYTDEEIQNAMLRSGLKLKRRISYHGRNIWIYRKAMTDGRN